MADFGVEAKGELRELRAPRRDADRARGARAAIRRRSGRARRSYGRRTCCTAARTQARPRAHAPQPGDALLLRGLPVLHADVERGRRRPLARSRLGRLRPGPSRVLHSRRRGLAHRPRARAAARRRPRAAAAGRAPARRGGRRRALRLPRGPVEAARGHDGRGLGGRLRNRAQADRAAARRARHAQEGERDAGRPMGPFPAGTRYSALDPELLLVGARDARRLGPARPLDIGSDGLAEADEVAYYEDMKTCARLFGTPPEVLAATLGRLPRLHRPDARQRRDLRHRHGARIASTVLHPPRAAALRPAMEVVNLVTAGLMPARLRRDYGLAWDPVRAALLLGSRQWVKRIAMPLLPGRLRRVPAAGAVILPGDEDRGLERHGHAARPEGGRGAEGAAGTSRSSHGALADDERADWAWASERAARDVVSGSRRPGDRLLLDGHRRLDRRQQGAGRARGALRRRRDGARRAHVERRERARAQPPRNVGGAARRRSSTRGSRRTPSDDPDDRANIDHIGELDHAIGRSGD